MIVLAPTPLSPFLRPDVARPALSSNAILHLPQRLTDVLVSKEVLYHNTSCVLKATA
jgi:hypothetical protein